MTTSHHARPGQAGGGARVDAAAIRAAVSDLGGQEPCWLERYQAGARLLTRGGWERRKQFVLFPHGIVCQPGSCTCQEGRGPIVCIHRVALAILDHADARPGRRAGGWPATLPMEGQLAELPA
jgi:hypothetical protein